MKKSTLIASIILTVWILGSSYWYVCITRNNCEDKTDEKKVERIESIQEISTLIEEDSIVQTESTQIDSLQVLRDYFSETGIYQVFFNYSLDKTNISDDDLSHFNKIKDYLTLNPAGIVVINGYSDSKGRETYNLELSRFRAGFIQHQLIKIGISNQQIEISAKGEIELGSQNSSKIDIEHSRRTDIYIKE